MRILAIGDIHGRKLWSSIIEKERSNVDVVVFLADYFDSRDGISASDQRDNFIDIMTTRESLQKDGIQVINLIGNHDYHYLKEVQEHYSNYQKHEAKLITLVLEQYRDELQMAYAYENFLFTHAGVSRAFCDLNGIQYDVTISDPMTNTRDIAVDINERFIHDPVLFGFSPMDPFDNHGESIYQGPIWIRPKSLGQSIIPGTHQIVGHTTVEHITTVESKIQANGKEYITGITLTDTLATREYLIIEDGKLITGTI